MMSYSSTRPASTREGKPACTAPVRFSSSSFASRSEMMVVVLSTLSLMRSRMWKYPSESCSTLAGFIDARNLVVMQPAGLCVRLLEGAVAVLSANAGAMASSLVPCAAAGEKKGRVRLVPLVVLPRPLPQQGAGRW